MLELRQAQSLKITGVLFDAILHKYHDSKGKCLKSPCKFLFILSCYFMQVLK